MRTKVIAITICQDCPKQDCAERTSCGTIPDTCPLPDKPHLHRVRERDP